MRGRTVWIALAGLVALLVGACGGGPTTEEFLEEANAICEEHRATIEEAASEVLAGGQMPDPQEFGELAQGTIIPELTAQFEELQEVEPSEEVAEEFETYLSEGEQVLEQLRQDPSFLMNPANFQEVNQAADEAQLSAACHLGPGG